MPSEMRVCLCEHKQIRQNMDDVYLVQVDGNAKVNEHFAARPAATPVYTFAPSSVL
jgi:hypothetical protein